MPSGRRTKRNLPTRLQTRDNLQDICQGQGRAQAETDERRQKSKQGKGRPTKWTPISGEGVRPVEPNGQPKRREKESGVENLAENSSAQMAGVSNFQCESARALEAEPNWCEPGPKGNGLTRSANSTWKRF